MRYDQWNKCLLDHFFNEEMEGRRVYVYVTRDLLDELGHALGGADGFIHAIRADMRGHAEQALCESALLRYHMWAADKSKPPGFFAYLALFALAADNAGDGGWSASAYYPHLRKLLGLGDCTGQVRDFSEMHGLWLGLQYWTRQVEAGRLGEYHFACRGGMKHVGVPFAQALLTKHDREHLPEVFRDAKLSPLAPPTSEVLLAKLTHYGRGRLLRRTERLIDSGDDARHLVADAVLEELLHWDGQVAQSKHTGSERAVYTELSLGLEVIGRCARFHLRCRASGDLPEDGISFRHGGRCWVAEPCTTGWSEPICDRDTLEYLDPSSLNWAYGFAMSREGGGTISLPPGQVRYFVYSHFSSGMCEAMAPQPDTPTYMAVHPERQAAVAEWGRSCAGFQEMRVLGGLPPNWRLYCADALNLNTRPQELGSAGQRMRITLHGGVRAVKGRQQYFSVAPPTILVEGWTPGAQVTCDTMGSQLPAIRPRPANLPSWFALPPEACAPGRVRLLLTHDGTEIESKRIILRDDDPEAPTVLPLRRFDGSYRVLGEPTAAWIAGAFLETDWTEVAETTSAPPDLLELLRWLLHAAEGLARTGCPYAALPSNLVTVLRRLVPTGTPHLPVANLFPAALMPQLKRMLERMEDTRDGRSE